MTDIPRAPTSPWPPVEPFFEWDIPIDERMFDIYGIVHVINVQRVIPRADGWMVDLAVVSDSTSHVTLSVDVALLNLFDGRERVAQHVLDAIRDWAERPLAERPAVVQIR